VYPGDRSCGYSPLAALGDQRPIAFYDQLGSGRSGRPTNLDLWQIDRFVDELEVVRNRLGLTRVHLLAHSFGTAVAVQYLLTKGTRGVESLILASPYLSTRDWIDDANVLRGQLPISVQEAMQRNEAAGTTNSDEYQEATRAYSRQFGRRRPCPPNPECAGSAFNPVIYRAMWGPSEFYATGNLLTFDVTNRLGELRLPVLFVVGRYDEARPETMTRYQRLVTGSQVQIIEEAGHSQLADEPEAFLRTVRDFLARVDRADAR
jgi:proline iminopeptidase